MEHVFLYHDQGRCEWRIAHMPNCYKNLGCYIVTLGIVNWKLIVTFFREVYSTHHIESCLNDRGYWGHGTTGAQEVGSCLMDFVGYHNNFVDKGKLICQISKLCWMRPLSQDEVQFLKTKYPSFSFKTKY